MTATSLVERLEQQARALGFTLFGVADAERSRHLDFYRAWLARDYHGEMAYLGRADSVARRADLRGTMETVRSVVVVAHEYYVEDEAEATADPSTAVIARYARGRDYHDVVKTKLDELLAWLDSEVEEGVRGRAYVDTGPILERDLARRAGLGWFGKNTMLIHPGRGSYFFVGLLLVDVDLPGSEPFEEDRCGSCRACLDACPTGALLGRDRDGAPVIDARRCISYLTIELRGPIPIELRPGVGNRVFGCDICQEACPWNQRFAEPSSEPAYRPERPLRRGSLLALFMEILAMDDEGFRARFRGSPIKRAKREGLLRNLAVALGNWLGEARGTEAERSRELADVVHSLEAALRDESPLVRSHAVWALGRAGVPTAETALRRLKEIERDHDVLRELTAALHL